MTCIHCRALLARVEQIQSAVNDIAARLPDPHQNFVVASQADERRREIFDFIADAADAGRITPTMEQIARATDLGPSNVSRYITQLADAGLLRKHGTPTQRVYEIVATGKRTERPPFRAGNRKRAR